MWHDLPLVGSSKQLALLIILKLRQSCCHFGLVKHVKGANDDLFEKQFNEVLEDHEYVAKLDRPSSKVG